MKPIQMAFLLLLMISCRSCAEEPGPPLATCAEVIQAVHVNPPPVIDGVLDDHCWTVASKVDGFAYRGKFPKVETTAYFCYDDEKIYIAFDSKDPEPSKIRAQQTKRGGNIFSDDFIEFSLDCQHDHRTTYWFAVNARGTQYESIPGGSASKVEWRGDWVAASRINDDGWTCEVEIPFSILRYPKGQDTFGLAFGRISTRCQESYDYPNMGDNWNSEYMIDWEGLVTPTIKRSFIYMPYTMTEIGADGGMRSGLDIKRTFDNNVVTALTIMPDFRTIERNVSSVDFSYNPQYLSDKRPFFTEGQGYFGDSKLLYSSGIDEIDAGGKVFGKIGPHKFGLLAFGDYDNFLSSYLSYYYTHTRLSIGGDLFSHHANGQDARVLKTEVRFRDPDAGWSTGTTLYRSFNRSAGNEGHIWDIWYDRWQRPGRLGFSFGQLDSSPDFSSPAGYVYDLGTRSRWGNLYYYDLPDEGPLRMWRCYMNVGHSTRYGGSVYSHYIGGGGYLSFRNHTGLSIGRSVSRRLDDRNRTWSANFSWSNDDIYRGGGFGMNWGKMAGADYRYFSISQGVKLTDRFSLNVGGEHLSMDYPPGHREPDLSRVQTSASVIYDITPEKGIGLGFRHREGRNNVFCTYRQEVRRGLDAYVLLGDPNSLSSTDRLSLKLVRVL